jgi:hypothetical protein
MKGPPPNHRAVQLLAASWRSVPVRAALALVLVTAITGWCVWAIPCRAQRAFQRSTAGQMIELYDQVAPQVEQRNQEVAELAGP